MVNDKRRTKEGQKKDSARVWPSIANGVLNSLSSSRGTSDLLQATLRLLDASRSLKSISSVNFRDEDQPPAPKEHRSTIKRILSPRPIPSFNDARTRFKTLVARTYTDAIMTREIDVYDERK